jgi:hypothetical protein
MAAKSNVKPPIFIEGSWGVYRAAHDGGQPASYLRGHNGFG